MVLCAENHFNSYMVRLKVSDGVNIEEISE